MLPTTWFLEPIDFPFQNTVFGLAIQGSELHVPFFNKKLQIRKVVGHSGTCWICRNFPTSVIQNPLLWKHRVLPASPFLEEDSAVAWLKVVIYHLVQHTLAVGILQLKC